MSAFAPIIIKDGSTVPVDVTYSPVKIDAAGVASYANRSGGIAIGFPTVTTSLRSASKASKNYKFMGKLTIPTLEVTSPSTATGIQPAPTKAYDCIAVVEFILPERSTLEERENVLAQMVNLLRTDAFGNAVSDFESTY